MVIITEEVLKNAIKDSCSKTEICKKLGYSTLNGNIWKKVQKYIDRFKIDLSHLDPFKINKERRKYEEIEKTCLVCTKQFKTQNGHPREKTVCSRSCSNTYFAKLRHTDESKKKVAKSLIKYNENEDKNRIVIISKNGVRRSCPLKSKICNFCSKSYETTYRKQKYCSRKCQGKGIWLDTEYRDKISSGIRYRVANGLHKGWATRKRLTPSYPEQYVINLMIENNLKYEYEHKVDKWFIDFANPDKKFALEIDGRQHDEEDRKERDKRKTEYLESLGWTVVRVRWQKPDKDFRDKLENILKDNFNGLCL